MYIQPLPPWRHTPTPSCKDTCIHAAQSCKHPNKAALAATTLLSPRISQSPPGCRRAANQFPTNNSDPQRKIQNRKQLIKTCFMSAFLYNERPLVFLPVHGGQLKKGAAEREKEGEPNCDRHSVSLCCSLMDVSEWCYSRAGEESTHTQICCRTPQFNLTLCTPHTCT